MDLHDEWDPVTGDDHTGTRPRGAGIILLFRIEFVAGLRKPENSNATCRRSRYARYDRFDPARHSRSEQRGTDVFVNAK